jgi:hypothetical protein
MDDFFFGEFWKDDGISIGASKFRFACARVPANSVAAHVERVLAGNKGLFGITSLYGSDLGVVLEAIGSENISKLMISTTTAVNTSGVVPYTYLVDIYMVNGIVRTTSANWVDHQEKYVDDMVSGMLGGIYRAKLQTRTIVNVKGISIDWLMDDREAVIKAFMKKARIMENDEHYASCLERCVNYVLPIGYNE